MIINRNEIDRHRGKIYDRMDNVHVDIFEVSEKPDVICDYNGIWFSYLSHIGNGTEFTINFPVFIFMEEPLHKLHIIEGSSGKYLRISSERLQVCFDGKNEYSFKLERMYAINKYIFGRYWKDEVEKANVTVIMEC